MKNNITYTLEHCGREKNFGFMECTLIVKSIFKFKFKLHMKIWEQYKNIDKWYRDASLPPFFFPLDFAIWFSRVHHYLCETQIWFYYIIGTWKSTCYCACPFFFKILKKCLNNIFFWIREFLHTYKNGTLAAIDYG